MHFPRNHLHLDHKLSSLWLIVYICILIRAWLIPPRPLSPFLEVSSFCFSSSYRPWLPSPPCGLSLPKVYLFSTHITEHLIIHVRGLFLTTSRFFFLLWSTFGPSVTPESLWNAEYGLSKYLWFAMYSKVDSWVKMRELGSSQPAG